VQQRRDSGKFLPQFFGHGARSFEVLHHMRRYEDHQFGPLAVVRLVPEQASEHRYFGEERKAVAALRAAAADQTTQRHRLVVVNGDRAPDLALGKGGRTECRVLNGVGRDIAHFLQDVERDGSAQIDARGYSQNDARRVVLDTVDDRRVARRYAHCLPRRDRDLVAHLQQRRTVVEHHHIGR
jgi:hypothetical protein